MPNWCMNTVVIKNKNKEAIDRVVNAYNKDGLCNEFIPIPEELKNTTSPNRVNAEEMMEKYGHADWYSFQVEKWGTKWDIARGELVRLSDNEVALSFDTAWSPPVPIYEKMTEEGYEVEAEYEEPGMGFEGKYTSESGDEFWEIEEEEEDEDEND